MSWPPSDSTLQFRLWGGFGEALRRLGEAFGASELILGGFGRLWETLGEPLGRLWEALGSFGRRFGESLGSLWEALGKLWEALGIPATRRRTTKTTIYKNVGSTQTPDKPALLAHVIVT